MDAFNVYLNGKLIDIVFYSKECKEKAEDVKRSLINHDGYNSNIVVRKAR